MTNTLDHTKIHLETLENALNIVEQMNHIVAQYGYVTYADVMDITGSDTQRARGDERHGWIQKIAEYDFHMFLGGVTLILPEPKPIPKRFDSPLSANVALDRRQQVMDHILREARDIFGMHKVVVSADIKNGDAPDGVVWLIANAYETTWVEAFNKIMSTPTADHPIDVPHPPHNESKRPILQSPWTPSYVDMAKQGERNSFPKKSISDDIPSHKDSTPLTDGITQLGIAFDATSSHWSTTPEYNLMFLRQIENYLNHKLEAQGHVFVNDALDSLGLQRTPVGAVKGWLKSNDNPIDFGLDRILDTVDNVPSMYVLTFNTDGVIYDKIG